MGFGNRLAGLLDQFSSRGDAAEIAGVVPDQLARYVRGHSKPSFETICRLCDAKGVSIHWLWSGEGTRAAGTDALEGYVDIPVYEVEASSGHGSYPTGEEVARNLAFRRDWISTQLRAPIDRLCVIFNRGDSNAPEINDGDAMLVDRSVERLVDDAFYVFQVNGSLLVKMIERQISGGVVLRSHNPAYREQVLSKGEAEDVLIFGRVRWRAGLV